MVFGDVWLATNLFKHVEEIVQFKDNIPNLLKLIEVQAPEISRPFLITCSVWGMPSNNLKEKGLQMSSACQNRTLCKRGFDH